jgi:hypothetical protein
LNPASGATNVSPNTSFAMDVVDLISGLVEPTVSIYVMLGGIVPAHEATAALTPEMLNTINSPAATNAPG